MEDAATRIEVIFEQALRRSAAERGAYVATACGSDARLRSRVEALLKAHDEAGGFMAESTGGDRGGGATLDARPVAGGDRHSHPARQAPGQHVEQAGASIGPYKLLQQIGEGAFGVVWMADQERPVRRRVALKIIKAGMDTKEVIARFEQERQALAMMDHPNIARVLDAGTTQTGRPYFVMELVRGVRITDYCDDQGLCTEERIELFITVCQAVQHAHQKGIIHRDLKPSNILVTMNDGEAVPKVIDFGVAKATQGRLTDGTLFTQFEQMIGTPLYMSPEQAELTSLDVDTRSDIYALGVLLYELLTGRTPIDTATMARAGMDEVRRLIREVDPPRPSARLRTLDGNELTTVAKRRHTDAAKLPSALRGDIDWIVMKCLEKDRKRRYDTANGLAMDLQRHLRNEVVVARPPTTAYLLSKLIRRNKVACVAGVAIAAALVIGIAASLWQAVRATRAEKRIASVLDELRASAPAFAEQARALAARERYDEAIEKLDYAIKLRPDSPEYLIAKADLLQSQLKLADAAAIYRQASRLKPAIERAKTSAALCDELLAAPTTDHGKLTRESLAKLYDVMLRQQRPAAEILPVARLLGEEKKLALEYWLARLKDLPASTERPLKDRLTIRDDGRLALDLSDTRVIDLSPLAGAPLATLDISRCKELANLAPLRQLIELIELNAGDTAVSDLTPLRDLRSLEKLDLSGSRVNDLSPLGGLRLKALRLVKCPVGDLAPIARMPLEELNLRKTRVADLSPLAGMPIKTLDLSFTPVQNFSPLSQLPLEKCYLERCQIGDLSVLRSGPLKELVLLECRQARNYATLSEIKTLELLLLSAWYRNLPAGEYEAIAALRNQPRLRQLGAGVFDPMERVEESTNTLVTRSEQGYAATGPAEVFWQEWDRDQAFLPALRKTGIRYNLHRHIGGRDHLEIFNEPLRDLSILKGAPVSMLTIWDCPFTDLTPIHDLKLKVLELRTDLVADLSPLRGMPLETLSLWGSRFTDLSPLAGLPIKSLYVDGCTSLTDVAALTQLPALQNVTLPMSARGLEELRKLPKLERIAFTRTQVNVDLWLPDTSAAEFWEDYVWVRRLHEAGITLRSLQRLNDGTWSVNVSDSAFSDLAVLRGIPISILLAQRTSVSDLSPLRGMPLKQLWLGETATVSDLSPLKGMPLEILAVNGTQATDLSALRGMPLRSLWLPDNATDLSPLKDCTGLTSVLLPPNAKDFEFLRTFPKLERIGFIQDPNQGWIPDKSAEEFWDEFGQPWAIALRNAGIKYTSVRIVEATPQAPAPAPTGRFVAINAAAAAADFAAAPAPASRPTGKSKKMWSVTIESTDFRDCSVFKGADNIRELHLDKTAVADLEPLRGLPLSKLSLVDANGVVDLGPLVGMPLEELVARSRKVADVSALRGMPLKILDLGGTAVSDLEPLRGMALRQLWLYNTQIADLSPLQGMPLEYLHISGTRVTDLAVVRGMPLTAVRLHYCTEISDISPLADCKQLREATLPPNAQNVELLRAALPGLQRLSFTEDTKTYHPDKTAAAFWKEYDTQGWMRALRKAGVAIKSVKQQPDGTSALDLSGAKLSDLSLLKGAPLSSLNLSKTRVVDLSPLKGMATLKSLRLSDTPLSDLTPLRTESSSLTDLTLSGTKITDLSALRGLPLTSLDTGNTAVTDLEPLRDMPLKDLWIYNTGITDLRPLEGMHLESLFMQGTKVTDISPLKGMPLHKLHLHYCPALTDLSPLAGAQELTELILPPNAKEIEFLRSFPKLERLAWKNDPLDYRPDMTAAEFWKDYDAKKKETGGK